MQRFLRAGAGGEHTWRLAGVSEGTAKMTFLSYREGEEDDPIGDPVVYKIVVGPDLKIITIENEMKP